MTIIVEGTGRMREAAQNIRRAFGPAALTTIAIAIAADAGKKLKEAVVQQCVDEIYELSGGLSPFTPMTLPALSEALGNSYGGNPEERTGALQRSHQLVNGGLTQTVNIDPAAGAEPEPHSGRVTVMDYAESVHEGYTQWVMGHNTGVYHVGRPWFQIAVERHGEEICEYVVLAFRVAAERLMGTI